MIEHWRKEWKQGDFPFDWVQLADFMAETPELVEKALGGTARIAKQDAERREEWCQAVIIDIGEGKDIRPKNKRGRGRTPGAGLAKDYGIKVAFHSPEFKKLDVVGNKAVVTLDTFGSSLQTFDVRSNT
jgi:sialate O-acetylesterase